MVAHLQKEANVELFTIKGTRGAQQHVTIEGGNISHEIIVKIYGLCNLACDYCYVYESRDQSWKVKPRKMSRATMDQVAVRIAEYLREHRLAALNIIIHGGEPLLAGIEDIAYLVRKCREAAPSDRTLRFAMQTNGTLLTTKVLDRLLELEVQVGVSLDGNKSGNVHRPLRGGKSSYEAASRGLSLLREDRYASIFSGLLGVTHLENDPVATYEHLAQYGVRIDFLWPLANWKDPPVGKASNTEPKYGEWLAAVFDHAYTHGVPPRAPVRLLEKLLLLISSKVTGKPIPPTADTDLVGPWAMGAIVIEVDGTFEGLDALKSAAEGEAFTGLNVHDDFLTKALVRLLQTTEQRGIHMLPTNCQSCSLQKICGGGYYPNRYDGQSYNNRSVYCADLTYLINHIYRWLKGEVEKRRGAK